LATLPILDSHVLFLCCDHATHPRNPHSFPTRRSSDLQWALIADYLPAPTSRRGRPFSDPRQMIEGIIYRYRTGIAWRDLPETFGKWQTVWTWHRRLAADGNWDAIHQALTAHPAKNDKADFTVSVASTIARAHQHATNISRVKKGLVELQGSGHRVA